MSYGDPLIENDIRARALALADALAASHPAAAAYQAVAQEFREQVAASTLPADQLTWFAIERVALKTGLPAVRMDRPDQPIPAGALVLVDPELAAPEPGAASLAALRAAAFVVAPASWGPALSRAHLQGLAVETPAPAPAPARRPAAP